MNEHLSFGNVWKAVQRDASADNRTREIRPYGMKRGFGGNVSMEEWGFLKSGQYLIHDRDGIGFSNTCDLSVTTE